MTNPNQEKKDPNTGKFKHNKLTNNESLRSQYKVIHNHVVNELGGPQIAKGISISNRMDEILGDINPDVLVKQNRAYINRYLAKLPKQNVNPLPLQKRSVQQLPLQSQPSSPPYPSRKVSASSSANKLLNPEAQRKLYNLEKEYNNQYDKLNVQLQQILTYQTKSNAEKTVKEMEIQQLRELAISFKQNLERNKAQIFNSIKDRQSSGIGRVDTPFFYSIAPDISKKSKNEEQILSKEEQEAQNSYRRAYANRMQDI